jgi:hypothetical protein
MTEPLEQLESSDSYLRRERVDEAGNEQTDAHVVILLSILAKTVPVSRGRRGS